MVTQESVWSVPNDRDRLALPTPGVDDGLIGLYALLNLMREDQKEAASLLARHEADFNRVLRGDGNGDRGLIPRLMKVETAVDTMRTQMERELSAIKSQLDRAEGALSVRSAASETGRWSLTEKVIIALLSGFFLLAATTLGMWIRTGGHS